MNKNPCAVCGSKFKSVFCNASSEKIKELDKAKVCNSYKKNQVLFEQGSPVHGIFCISNGKVKLVKTGEDGKESILRIATSGDVIGHRSFLAGQHFQASAVALDDVNVCFFDAHTFKKAIEEDPSISLELLSKLSDTLGEAESRLSSMSQQSVKERTASFLLYLRSAFGKEEKCDKIRLEINLSREEMASIVGTTTESMIRTLSNFKKDGLLEQDGKILILKDIAKLSLLSGLTD